MWYQSYKDGILITLKVTPRASKTRILGEEEEWLRLALQAPPVDGKANDAVILWFAKTLSIPRKSIELISGQTARLKKLHLHGVSETVIREAINADKR